VHLAAALQAFVVGQRAGIAPQALYDIVTASTGDSAMLRRGARNLFADDFEPGFKLDLLLKDLRLATEMGDEAGVPLSLAAAARKVYEAAQQQGLGERDIAAAVLAMPWERISPHNQT
jgi:3-hydroxyisobutyrate dehydrogenase-like beta-hydroxyacid dehydrogenase